MVASWRWTYVVGDVAPPAAPRKDGALVIASTNASTGLPVPLPARSVMLAELRSTPAAVKPRSPVPSLPAWSRIDVAPLTSPATSRSPVALTVTVVAASSEFDADKVTPAAFTVTWAACDSSVAPTAALPVWARTTSPVVAVIVPVPEFENPAPVLLKPVPAVTGPFTATAPAPPSKAVVEAEATDPADVTASPDPVTSTAPAMDESPDATVTSPLPVRVRLSSAVTEAFTSIVVPLMDTVWFEAFSEASIVSLMTTAPVWLMVTLPSVAWMNAPEFDVKPTPLLLTFVPTVTGPENTTLPVEVSANDPPDSPRVTLEFPDSTIWMSPATDPPLPSSDRV
ncbi:MAG: hypothetical protein GIKADHBN_03240 [Phycisphaerales bacterium]|nr:hypothetical protein [Phycisphaerales bacterium]